MIFFNQYHSFEMASVVRINFVSSHNRVTRLIGIVCSAMENSFDFVADQINCSHLYVYNAKPTDRISLDMATVYCIDVDSSLSECKFFVDDDLCYDHVTTDFGFSDHNPDACRSISIMTRPSTGFKAITIWFK